MIRLNYRDSQPIGQQIKEGIIRLILCNAVMADEMLPSIREFAAKMAINPLVVRNAYQELEKEGYLYHVEEQGYFVAKNVPVVCEELLLREFDELVEKLLRSMKREQLIERMNSVPGGEVKPW